MSTLSHETVLSVQHWNETLFSFTSSRDGGLRFKNGHFLMIGLEVEGRPLMRAYSLASPNYEDHLEFLSIKVPDGPLTSRLQHLRPGDRILVNRRPTGTLVLTTLRPGKRLYLLATGTGLAPFMSIVRDPETYERYEHIVLVHGVRRVSDLAYADYLRNELIQNEYFGEQVRRQLRYLPTVTREPFETSARITDLMESGALSSKVDLPPLDPEHDRVMLCGSPQMLDDLMAMLIERRFTEGSTHDPREFTVERAFVER